MIEFTCIEASGFTEHRRTKFLAKDFTTAKTMAEKWKEHTYSWLILESESGMVANFVADEWTRAVQKS